MLVISLTEAASRHIFFLSSERLACTRQAGRRAQMPETNTEKCGGDLKGPTRDVKIIVFFGGREVPKNDLVGDSAVLGSWALLEKQIKAEQRESHPCPKMDSHEGERSPPT